jgi:hypothetical protein
MIGACGWLFKKKSVTMPSFGLRNLKTDTFISSGALASLRPKINPSTPKTLKHNTDRSAGSNIVCGMNELMFVVLCSDDEG